MLNVGKLSDSEMHQKLAAHLVMRWHKFGITLRQTRKSFVETNFQIKAFDNPDLQLDCISQIDEEKDNKARAIFNDYQNPNKAQENQVSQQIEEIESLNDVQLVNRYH